MNVFHEQTGHAMPMCARKRAQGAHRQGPSDLSTPSARAPVQGRCSSYRPAIQASSHMPHSLGVGQEHLRLDGRALKDLVQRH